MKAKFNPVLSLLGQLSRRNLVTQTLKRILFGRGLSLYDLRSLADRSLRGGPGPQRRRSPARGPGPPSARLESSCDVVSYTRHSLRSLSGVSTRCLPLAARRSEGA